MSDSNSQNSSERFATAPISQLLGFEIEAGEPGSAVVHLPIDERLNNPMGRTHGGIFAALADAAMGIAFGRTIEDSQDFATIDLHIHFIRGVRGDRITATAKVSRRGLRIGFVDCQIFDNRERLIATASCSCTILEQLG